MNFIYNHNLSPLLFFNEIFSIRYYGFFLSLAIFILYVYNYFSWRNSRQLEYFDFFVIFVGLISMISSRFFHVFFYDLEYFSKYPLQILYIWKGGIASHGGIFGLFLGTYLFSRISYFRRKNFYFFSYRNLTSFLFPCLLAFVFIRFGNFVNGEIVGRITNSPIAVSYSSSTYELPSYLVKYYGKLILDSPSFRLKIIKYHSKKDPSINEKNLIDLVKDNKIALLRYILSSSPRHFSQFYEAFISFIIFCIFLYFYIKKTFERYIIVHLALSCIFLGRFFVEYYKEFQILTPDYLLTMGQYLSIPYIIVFLGISIYFQFKKERLVKASK